IFIAKSAETGVYVITVTFKVTFTIKKPNTPSHEVSYTGSSSATLNVENGKFEVKIKPSVLIPQFVGDTNGYRNKLGIGE
ncbi:MAG: hypothetical protein LBC74_00890, partial [Planctomycetaceae bacterium]|nr:hypothetical protein [Planctomycetaceae bacterium]